MLFVIVHLFKFINKVTSVELLLITRSLYACFRPCAFVRAFMRAYVWKG